MFDNLKKKSYEKEYLKEYVKVCDNITHEMIYKKKIKVIYDEMIPDLFVEISTDNRKVKQVDYDIYADRLKRVKVKFPNGKHEVFNISKVEDIKEHDGLYTFDWKVPYISIKYNGLDIPLSLIDLICDGVEVSVIEYDLEGEDINEKTYD